MNDPVLELRNIRKSFGQGEVLRGISLQAAQGEFITLLGSSGCGKTTILRITAGLESCDSGTVLLEGREGEQLLNLERLGVSGITAHYLSPREAALVAAQYA